LERRNEPLVAIVGQLANTASIRESQAEFAAMTAQLQAAYPDALKGAGAKVAAYSATALLPMADMAPYFLAAFSIITLLTLVIVSANVANLMLGRAVERQRETAVRQSLGASKPRILRMLVAEGVAIALVAWAASCVIAWWTTRLMLRVLEPQPGLLSQARPDWTLAATAMLLAVGATVAFTVAPAIQTWRLPLLPLLKSGAQSVIVGRSRLSNALMIVQLSFSVLLLTSAGFAVRSLSMLDSGDVGFDPRNMLLVTVRLGQRSAIAGPSPTPQQRETERAAIDRIRTRLVDEPGVRAVSYSRRVPGAYFLATTAATPAGASEPTPVFMRPIGPDYLRSLGLEATVGRDLAPDDRPGNTRVAVINRQLADELWPGQSPLGRILHLGQRRDPVEIVGVAPNALYDGPVHDPHPRYVFTPQHQLDDARLIDMTFFIRFEGTLEAVAPRIGRAISEVERSLPIVAMTTMQSRLDGVTILERQVTTLLIAFAFASLVVAAIGQYAVAAFNMRRRTRDFGVRMALGASARQIQRSVLSESLRLTLLGLAVGFLLSAAAGLGFERVLFGITPTDPPTYLAVFAVLAVASIIASYLPAWRAGRVNVVDVLRQE
jgi:predicted permease